MLSPRYQFVTPATRSDYRQFVSSIAGASWPEFMLNDPIADRYWDDLFTRFSDYQFALLDTATGRPAAMANSLVLHWDEDVNNLPEGGWDWAFEQAVSDHQRGLAPRTQCAIQIAIHPDYRSQGLSTHMVQRMRSIGEAKGFKKLVAPVRPNQKSLYPLIDIDRYIQWKTPDGLPFDAWLRVHVRLGAKIIKPCHQAMTIRGTKAEWEAWTGMQFPESGAYIIPGALHPMQFNLEADQGLYVEANVWTVHELQ